MGQIVLFVNPLTFSYKQWKFMVSYAKIVNIERYNSECESKLDVL